MASRHFSFKTGKVGSGAKHALYIAGVGKYADRDDVIHLVDANLPVWASSGDIFFEAADVLERANGRAYSEIEFAIPRECKNPVEYANDYAKNLLGSDHVYRLAVHDKKAADGGRNIHGHLMFSERKLDGFLRSREQFFKRANSKHPERGGAAKDRKWNDRQQIDALRRGYEVHAKQHGIALDLRSNEAQGLGLVEPKIGPNKVRKQRDVFRETRAASVRQIRRIRATEVELESALSGVRATIKAERYKEPVSIPVRTSTGWVMPQELVRRRTETPKETPVKEVRLPLEIPSLRREITLPILIDLEPFVPSPRTQLIRLADQERVSLPSIGCQIDPMTISRPVRSNTPEVVIQEALRITSEQAERTRSELIERRNRAFGVISQHASEIERRSNQYEQEERRTDKAKPGVRAVFIANQCQFIEIPGISRKSVWREPEVIEAGSRTQCVDQTNGRRRGALLSRGDRLGEAFNQFVSAARQRAKKLVTELEKKPSFSELFDEWMGKLKSLFGPHYSPLKERDEVEGKVIGRLEYEGEVAIAVRRYGQEWTVAKGVDYPEGYIINIKSRNGVIQGVSVQSLGQREGLRRS